MYAVYSASLSARLETFILQGTKEDDHKVDQYRIWKHHFSESDDFDRQSESAPIKRMIQDARDRGMLIDATYGRRTRAVVIMDSDHVILSAVQPETVAQKTFCKRRNHR